PGRYSADHVADQPRPADDAVFRDDAGADSEPIAGVHEATGDDPGGFYGRGGYARTRHPDRVPVPQAGPDVDAVPDSAEPGPGPDDRLRPEVSAGGAGRRGHGRVGA